MASSSSEVGPERMFVMEADQVPAALQARLGDEATEGLLLLLDRSHREARENLISACTERFERRLVEETSGLRVQIAQLGAELRQERAWDDLHLG